jgi:hypothetical protein
LPPNVSVWEDGREEGRKEVKENKFKKFKKEIQE